MAAGTCGPARYRYGGVRDFIIGARFVDGTGALVGGGGKVVKNAAGFDLPKLMVGSLGRLGVLVEVTFKVFPAPQARRRTWSSTARLDAALAAMRARCAAGPRPRSPRPRAARPPAGPPRRPPARSGTRSSACARVLGLPAEKLLGERDAELWDGGARARVGAAGGARSSGSRSARAAPLRSTPG